jgi:hypothetical protein
MITKLASVVLALGLLFACGCASQMESVNQGANQAGQAAGGVMRVPNSVSEGAAQGVAGQPSPNPYGR